MYKPVASIVPPVASSATVVVLPETGVGILMAAALALGIGLGVWAIIYTLHAYVWKKSK